MRQPNANTIKINNMEDIKTGEYYRVLGYVGYKNENEVSVTFHNKSGVQTSIDFERKEARKIFSPISEPPKYDPNREFREGDKVRVRKIHGKLPQCRYNGMVKVKEGDCCTIHSKEHRNCYWVTIPSGAHYCFDIAYFELVTPVEELKPYSVKLRQEITVDDTYPYCAVVDYDGNEAARFYCEQYEAGKAKAAAEAERDRLNAEYRKEHQQ